MKAEPKDNITLHQTWRVLRSSNSYIGGNPRSGVDEMNHAARKSTNDDARRKREERLTLS